MPDDQSKARSNSTSSVGGNDYCPSVNELLSADSEQFRCLTGKLTKEWLLFLLRDTVEHLKQAKLSNSLFSIDSKLDEFKGCLRSSSPNQNNYTSTFTSSSSWSDVVKKSLNEHDYDVAASQTVVLYNVKEGNLDNATEHETSEILNSIQISPNIVVNSSRLGKKKPDPTAKQRLIEIKLNSVYEKRLLMANAYMLKGTVVFVKPKLNWRDRQKEKALLGLRYNLIKKGMERNLMRIRDLQLFYDGKLLNDQLFPDELLYSLASHISSKND